MRNSVAFLTLCVLSIACTGVPSGGVVHAASSDKIRLTPPVGDWSLVSIAGSDDTMAPNVTLILQDDGAISGSGGCNGYFGSWSLEEGQRVIGPIGATRRMCEPDVMGVEMRYFDALSRVGGWLPMDGGIKLANEAGKTLLTFRPR